MTPNRARRTGALALPGPSRALALWDERRKLGSRLADTPPALVGPCAPPGLCGPRPCAHLGHEASVASQPRAYERRPRPVSQILETQWPSPSAPAAWLMSQKARALSQAGGAAGRAALSPLRLGHTVCGAPASSSSPPRHARSRAAAATCPAASWECALRVLITRRGPRAGSSAETGAGRGPRSGPQRCLPPLRYCFLTLPFGCTAGPLCMLRAQTLHTSHNPRGQMEVQRFMTYGKCERRRPWGHD